MKNMVLHNYVVRYIIVPKAGEKRPCDRGIYIACYLIGEKKRTFCGSRAFLKKLVFQIFVHLLEQAGEFGFFLGGKTGCKELFGILKNV